MTGSGFWPAWWCRNPHGQTLWSRLVHYRPSLTLHRERVELIDGDFIDLDWVNFSNTSQPIVLVIHGLEGSSQSPYVRGILKAIEQRGWRGAVMNLRGCSGEDNRLARAYHSGDTDDVHTIIQHLKTQHPDTPLAVVGYSIGGNMLLKWLGEQGRNHPTHINATVAVSVPFDLGNCADVLSHSLFRLYENYFMKRLKARIMRKQQTMAMPVSEPELQQLSSIREFDDKITAPLHGFTDANDYYSRSSCRQYLPNIKHDCLIIHAKDDPFMTPSVIPDASELSDSIIMELYDYGGHVGFVSGSIPGRANYWLEQRIIEYLGPRMNTND